MTRLRCVTWNVHRGRGADGRVDPRRVAGALVRDVCPPGSIEILALQEADDETPPHAGVLDLEAVEAATGLRSIQGADDLRWGPRSHGFLGVLTLFGPAIDVIGVRALDLPGHCHRGAVVADAQLGETRFRVVNTHLSLGQPVRIAQLRTIGQYLARRPSMPTLLMGDLNEWRPWSGLALSPRIVLHRFEGPALATFPTARPVLPLDRILATPPARVEAPRVYDTPGIRAASDHRPLAAEVALRVV